MTHPGLKGPGYMDTFMHMHMQTFTLIHMCTHAFTVIFAGTGTGKLHTLIKKTKKNIMHLSVCEVLIITLYHLHLPFFYITELLPSL